MQHHFPRHFLLSDIILDFSSSAGFLVAIMVAIRHCNSVSNSNACHYGVAPIPLFVLRRSACLRAGAPGAATNTYVVHVSQLRIRLIAHETIEDGSVVGRATGS